MNLNINIPGLKDIIIEKAEEIGHLNALYVSLPIKTHKCPQCNETIVKVHDWRLYFIDGVAMLVSGENADGFRRFDHARAKVLSNIKYKEIGVDLG